MDIEVKMPDVGLDEVEVIEILVKVHDQVDLEQGLITIEGDKASMEIPSPISGIVKKIYVKIGDKIKLSTPIMILKKNDLNNDTKETNINSFKKEEKNSNDINEILNNNYKKNIFVHATPVIRRLARNLNIDLQKVFGTGRKNRILKDDIEKYYNISKANIPEDNNRINLNILKNRKTEEIELGSLQKNIGDNLHKNWINIPHVTQFDEVNITILEEFRKKYNSENKNSKQVNNNITILVFVIKVVAHALEKFPIFNSSLNIDNKKIIFKKYINIGVAVDVNNGLLVPVLRDVNKKNIEQLSYELMCLSEKARRKTLNTSEMTEGCFTISNLGKIGGGWFSPIINAPEVAILGISRSQIKPFWNGKEFIPSLMLPLSLSYDHRVINGADAARFITFINKLLSDIHFLIM
ncbi:2-oxo acid dehydrogenase subunit E2 [Buchnera aphidicola]|nr:2-oxo acid dehydrogenase subunit E2 [Buchnera aphidicola]